VHSRYYCTTSFLRCRALGGIGGREEPGRFFWRKSDKRQDEEKIEEREMRYDERNKRNAAKDSGGNTKNCW
jgi:hypothetical protein